MSDYGVFEDIEGSSGEKKIATRETQRKLDAAIQDVKSQYGTFLYASRDSEEWNDRVALCKDDMLRTINAHLMPVTGVVRRIVKACRDDWKRHADKVKELDPQGDWEAYLKSVDSTSDAAVENCFKEGNIRLAVGDDDSIVNRLTKSLNGLLSSGDGKGGFFSVPFSNPFNDLLKDAPADKSMGFRPQRGDAPAADRSESQKQINRTNINTGLPDQALSQVKSPQQGQAQNVNRTDPGGKGGSGGSGGSGGGGGGAGGGGGSDWTPNGNKNSIGAGDYKIQKGDTLTSIGERSGVSVDDLMKGNSQIKNKDMIFADDTMKIPGAGKAATTPGGPGAFDFLPTGFGGKQEPTTQNYQDAGVAAPAGTPAPAPAAGQQVKSSLAVSQYIDWCDSFSARRASIKNLDIYAQNLNDAAYFEIASALTDSSSPIYRSAAPVGGNGAPAPAAPAPAPDKRGIDYLQPGNATGGPVYEPPKGSAADMSQAITQAYSPGGAASTWPKTSNAMDGMGGPGKSKGKSKSDGLKINPDELKDGKDSKNAWGWSGGPAKLDYTKDAVSQYIDWCDSFGARRASIKNLDIYAQNLNDAAYFEIASALTDSSSPIYRSAAPAGGNGTPAPQANGSTGPMDGIDPDGLSYGDHMVLDAIGSGQNGLSNSLWAAQGQHEGRRTAMDGMGGPGKSKGKSKSDGLKINPDELKDGKDSKNAWGWSGGPAKLDYTKDAQKRTAAPDYLQKADEALTNLLNQKAEEFQETISPLQQALQTVQQAEQAQQMANPMGVQPPAGTVNVLPGDPSGGGDPAAGGGDPSQGGMDPAMLQQLMGGGGDPSGGGMPPGGDPSMGGDPQQMMARLRFSRLHQAKGCNCWEGYKRVPGTKPCAKGSCEKCDSHSKESRRRRQAAEEERTFLDGDWVGQGASGKYPFSYGPRQFDNPPNKHIDYESNGWGSWYDDERDPGDYEGRHRADDRQAGNLDVPPAEFKRRGPAGYDKFNQGLGRHRETAEDDWGHDFEVSRVDGKYTDDFSNHREWRDPKGDTPIGGPPLETNYKGKHRAEAANRGKGRGAANRPLNRQRNSGVVNDFDEFVQGRGVEDASAAQSFADKQNYSQRGINVLQQHTGQPALQKAMKPKSLTTPNGKPGKPKLTAAQRKQAWQGWGAAQSFSRRVAGWEWDDHLNGYLANKPNDFTCKCGALHAVPSYAICKCGKIWNSYVIGTGGDNHTASVEKFICREIPVRDNVIVASRRHAKRWTCECGRDDNDDARCNDCGGWGPDGPADNRHEYRESYRKRSEKVTRHDLSDPGPLGKGKDDKMPTIKEDLGDEWYRHGPGGKWVARKKSR